MAYRSSPLVCPSKVMLQSVPTYPLLRTRRKEKQQVQEHIPQAARCTFSLQRWLRHTFPSGTPGNSHILSSASDKRKFRHGNHLSEVKPKDKELTVPPPFEHARLFNPMQLHSWLRIDRNSFACSQVEMPKCKWGGTFFPRLLIQVSHVQMESERLMELLWHAARAEHIIKRLLSHLPPLHTHTQAYFAFATRARHII